MFGRATVTLGIGPHSSLAYNLFIQHLRQRTALRTAARRYALRCGVNAALCVTWVTLGSSFDILEFFCLKLGQAWDIHTYSETV